VASAYRLKDGADVVPERTRTAGDLAVVVASSHKFVVPALAGIPTGLGGVLPPKGGTTNYAPLNRAKVAKGEGVNGKGQ
jgi:hypothetical protein